MVRGREGRGRSAAHCAEEQLWPDTDTDCLKPVTEWGMTDAVVWDLGDAVSEEIAYGPAQVVVGIEVDVPDLTNWETFWP